MADEKTIIMTPDGQSGTVPAWLAYGNNGWGNNGFFGNGFGSSFFGGLLGAIVPGLFGGWGGWGGQGGNGAAAASLGAQATANSNAEMILNAINGTDADVRLLATTLNGDVDSLRLGVNTIQGAIATLAGQLGLTGQQVINAIQSGDAAMQSQLCQCCCQMKQLVAEQGYQNQLATLNQTNTLSTAIAGAGQRNVDAIADLKATMIQSFCDVKEREMQSKIDTQADIIGQLRNAADNAAQTNQILAYINSVFGPLQAQVSAIAGKLPNTVPVVYPNLTVTPASTTPTTGA